MKTTLALIFLLTFALESVPAQMMHFPAQANGASKTTLLADDDLDDFTKRRKRRRSSRGRGGSELGIVLNPSLALGLPMGDMKDLNTGLGLSLDGLYFMDKLGLGLYTGYHSFKVDYSIGINFFGMFLGAEIEGNESYMPFIPQVVYLFSDQPFKPYAGLGLGLYVISGSGTVRETVDLGTLHPVTQEPLFETFESDYSESRSGFALSPVLGMYYDLSDQIMLSFSARWNMIFLKDTYEDGSGATIEQNVTHTYFNPNAGIAIKLGN
jgi:hypothetical protein